MKVLQVLLLAVIAWIATWALLSALCRVFLS